MRIPAIVLVFFLLLCGAVACIDEVPYELRIAPRLVIEGLITNQPPPYKVSVTYTSSKRGARSATEATGVSEAQVSISDNLGNTVNLIQGKPGEYLTADPSFVGVPGRSYTLSIRLSDGREYTSRPEKLLPVPDMDQLYYKVNDQLKDIERAGIYVYVDIQDPAETADYYRWLATGYSMRPSTGVCCPWSRPPESCSKCYTQCWMRTDNLAANTFSDELVNGNRIRQPVYISPIRMRGMHLVEVSQYSLTREAYRFWERYEEQRIRTGSILDPLPEPIEGNVYNVNDQNDIALGYFGASSVYRKRITTDPFAIDGDRVLYYEQLFMREGDCRVAWPGSEYDAGRVDEWKK
jgi:hypothetical protein